MKYKIEFESVSAVGEGNQFYCGDEPNCRPDNVPNNFWHKTIRETEDPQQQYKTLLGWAKEGTQLIRNVKLFKSDVNPEWKEIDSP